MANGKAKMTKEDFLKLSHEMLMNEKKCNEITMSLLENLDSKVYKLRGTKISYQIDFLNELKALVLNLGFTEIIQEIESMKKKEFTLSIQLDYTQVFVSEECKYNVEYYSGIMKTNLPSIKYISDNGYKIFDYSNPVNFEFSSYTRDNFELAITEELNYLLSKKFFISLPERNLNRSELTLPGKVLEFAKNENLELELEIYRVGYFKDNFTLTFRITNNSKLANEFKIEVVASLNYTIEQMDNYLNKNSDQTTMNFLEEEEKILDMVKQYVLYLEFAEKEKEDRALSTHSASEAKAFELIEKQLEDKGLEFSLTAKTKFVNSNFECDNEEELKLLLPAKFFILLENKSIVNINISEENEIDYSFDIYNRKSKYKVSGTLFNESYVANLKSLEDLSKEILDICSNAVVLYSN